MPTIETLTRRARRVRHRPARYIAQSWDQLMTEVEELHAENDSYALQELADYMNSHREEDERIDAAVSVVHAIIERIEEEDESPTGDIVTAYLDIVVLMTEAGFVDPIEDDSE